MKSKQSIVKAVVLAGGFSRRIKSALPKQLIKIGKRPLLAHTLDVFEDSRVIDRVILVANKKFLPNFRALIKKNAYKKVERLCCGGKTRQQSVYNALQTIGRCDYVIIHDGVRPFLSERVLEQIVKAVKRYPAVTLAVKAIDTIVEAKDAFVTQALLRRSLWCIQTPQAFRATLIVGAHKQAQAARLNDITDDAQLVMRLGNRVKIIPGEYRNIKITTQGDLALAAYLLGNTEKKRGKICRKSLS
ncbi:MAG: 2-C-methyl-D-erythritol 4-phosphate cytidylyltransferase [Candidatus Omnitrophota bacterium]